MPQITEIAPDVFRLSFFLPQYDLQFNHFLIRDEQPLLYHTGMRSLFPELRAAVAQVLDPTTLRWIGFSHFEVDECGALNDWLAVAPHAQAVCGTIGALVNLNDFAVRPPRALADGELLATGRGRVRYVATPHLPHGWDAGALFEETHRTLFCSDLFHHTGDVEPVTEADIVGRTRQALVAYQAGPLLDYMPLHTKTLRHLARLAELQPRMLATMHGSTFVGDGRRALHDLGTVMQEVLGPA